MIGTVLLIAFYLLFPALALWLAERKIAFIHKVGPVVLCYVVGLALGNAGVLPTSAAAVQDAINTAAIPLALPLMFFSLDVRGWARSGPRALLSFALEVLAIAAVATGGFLLFRNALGGETAKVAGMLVGVYTGGTINLAAIGTALRVLPAVYVAANASDIVLSGLYLLFLMTIGKRIIRSILPASPAAGAEAAETMEGTSSFRGLTERGVAGPLAAALGLAVLIAAAGASLAILVPGGWGTIAAILAVTTLGIVASFSARVRKIRLTFALGHYFILVFSLVIGTMANLTTLATAAPAVAGFVAIAIFGSLALHVLLAAIFRIDADTMMITSVAGICSPPFVPMVAASLGNKRVIAPGVITGIIGWVIGTYLGIGLALLLGASG
jgi:uncharacterized membrane protein